MYKVVYGQGIDEMAHCLIVLVIDYVLHNLDVSLMRQFGPRTYHTPHIFFRRRRGVTIGMDTERTLRDQVGRPLTPRKIDRSSA